MNNIASPDELFTFLRIDRESVQPAQREVAQMILDGVANEIERFTRTSFVLVTDAEIVVNGTGTRVLTLDEQPLIAVSSITTSDDMLVQPDNYEWSSDGRLRMKLGCWLNRLRYYTVVCTHGWETVPESVRLVALRVAARGYSNPTSLTQESAGGWSGGYGFDATRFVALTDTDRAQLREGFMNR